MAEHKDKIKPTTKKVVSFGVIPCISGWFGRGVARSGGGGGAFAFWLDLFKVLLLYCTVLIFKSGELPRRHVNNPMNKSKRQIVRLFNFCQIFDNDRSGAV